MFKAYTFSAINVMHVSAPCLLIVYMLLCLGAHAQARYTVVCLCVSACVDCYSFSRINMVFWISFRGFANYYYLLGMPFPAFSEDCIAYLVHELHLER